MAKNCEHVFGAWDNIGYGAKCEVCGEHCDIDDILGFAEMYFMNELMKYEKLTTNPSKAETTTPIGDGYSQ